MGQWTADSTAPARAHASTATRDERISIAHRIEYIAAAGILKILGWLPHRFSRAACAVLGALSYWLWPRLRRVGLFNLQLAFPDWSDRQRRRVIFRLFQNLGRMLADFSRFPRLNSSNISRLIVYDAFENFERAQAEGKGIIFLTAHFGNWELSSFAHGLYGYPCNYVVRELDNRRIDELVNRYRSSSGGRAIEKREFAFQAIRAIKQGQQVGILMDQNMQPSEGIFVDFFGRKACTTTGPARLAQKTGAAIVLGLVIWDEAARKYRLHFDRVEWIRRENPEEEVAVNTANFNKLIEEYVRRHPDHWLWVHRRWKTRPPGEPPLYPF